MKPRLRYSPSYRCWFCSGSHVFACGSSPRCAYAVWNQRISEKLMRECLGIES